MRIVRYSHKANNLNYIKYPSKNFVGTPYGVFVKDKDSDDYFDVIQMGPYFKEKVVNNYNLDKEHIYIGWYSIFYAVHLPSIGKPFELVTKEIMGKKYESFYFPVYPISVSDDEISFARIPMYHNIRARLEITNTDYKLPTITHLEGIYRWFPEICEALTDMGLGYEIPFHSNHKYWTTNGDLRNRDIKTLGELSYFQCGLFPFSVFPEKVTNYGHLLLVRSIKAF